MRIISDIVVENEHYSPRDDDAFFGTFGVQLTQNIIPPPQHIPPEWDMYDLLVHIGAFRSKSEARKNWKKTGRDIPPGYSEFTYGKLKNELAIWNTTESLDEC